MQSIDLTSELNDWLGAGFMASLRKFPDRPALDVDGSTLSYRELYRRASRLAKALDARAPLDEPPLTAVLASRSQTAFVGIFAALLRGHGYVPLNPNLPADRTRYMLQQAGCRAVIVDKQGEKGLEELLQDIDWPLILVFPDACNADDLVRRFPEHQVLAGPLPPALE